MQECASPVWKHGTQLPVIAVLARVDSLQVNMEGYGWRPELLLACGCHDTRHHKPVDVKLACWLGMVLLQASLSGVCSSLILLPPAVAEADAQGHKHICGAQQAHPCGAVQELLHCLAQS